MGICASDREQEEEQPQQGKQVSSNDRPVAKSGSSSSNVSKQPSGKSDTSKSGSKSKSKRKSSKGSERRRRRSSQNDSGDEASDKDDWKIAMISRLPKKNRREHYKLHEEAGQGASCRVMRGRVRETKEKVAVKILSKHSRDDNLTLFLSEWAILEQLQHPNIVSLVEAFEDDKYYHLVTKFCLGGELFEAIINKGKFSERDASRMAADIIRAVAYCHDQKVTHRDLKPENLLLADKSDESAIKLIDFGCALNLADDEAVDDVAGSPYYVAPEVLAPEKRRKRHGLNTGKVWRASDMWSIGVIIYLMLQGNVPFNRKRGEPKGNGPIYERIRRGKFSFSKKVVLSEEAKDLINRLLTKDVNKRITAKQALEHPWIATNVAPEEPLPSEWLEKLSNWHTHTKLKKAVARVMAGTMHPEDQKELASLFKKFDTNGDGQLSAEEIKAMMLEIGQTEEDGEALLAEFDADGDGQLNVDEFGTASKASDLTTNTDEIEEAFRLFDKDGDGKITAAEIEAMVSDANNDIALQMIAEVDKDGDGEIDFQEWIDAMRGMKKESGTKKKKKSKGKGKGKGKKKGKNQV